MRSLILAFLVTVLVCVDDRPRVEMYGGITGDGACISHVASLAFVKRVTSTITEWEGVVDEGGSIRLRYNHERDSFVAYLVIVHPDGNVTTIWVGIRRGKRWRAYDARGFGLRGWWERSR